MCTSPTPPTKKQERAAAMQAREQARLDERLARAAAIERERERALRLTRVPPPEVAQWGVMRTRAWLSAARRCRGIACRKRVDPHYLAQLCHIVEMVPGMELSECVQLLEA